MDIKRIFEIINNSVNEVKSWPIWKQKGSVRANEPYDFYQEIIKIEELEKEGCTHHCACRQVFGDGECECHFYVKRYDP